MYGAYGQGGQQSQYGYNQQQQQQQYGAPPAQQQYQYQQQQPPSQQYQQQPTQTQMQQTQQPAANANVNVVQPEQTVVESSKPAPIYVDTQHDDMVRFISFSIYHTNLLKTFLVTNLFYHLFCIDCLIIFLYF